jgi:hypothetical protein
MRALLICTLLAATALSACGKKTEADAPAAAPPPAEAPKPAPGPEAALSNLPPDFAAWADCAGAYAAMGAVDRKTEEQVPTAPWFQDYAEIQIRLQTSPGKPEAAVLTPVLFGRRYYWNDQPQAQTQAKAEACRAQYSMKG